MSDLVARLRDADTTRRIGESYADTHERRQRDRDQAAAEIERLRAGNRDLQLWFDDLKIEYDKLRAALREIASWEPGASAVARAALAEEKPNE